MAEGHGAAVEGAGWNRPAAGRGVAEARLGSRIPTFGRLEQGQITHGTPQAAELKEESPYFWGIPVRFMVWRGSNNVPTTNG